jgi:hypothetical protein
MQLNVENTFKINEIKIRRVNFSAKKTLKEIFSFRDFPG